MVCFDGFKYLINMNSRIESGLRFKILKRSVDTDFLGLPYDFTLTVI